MSRKLITGVIATGAVIIAGAVGFIVKKSKGESTITAVTETVTEVVNQG